MTTFTEAQATVATNGASPSPSTISALGDRAVSTPPARMPAGSAEMGRIVRVLETRRRDGMTVRRCLLDTGKRITTYELPEVVVRWLGMRKVREAIASTSRGASRLRRAAEIRQFVAERMDWKGEALAHALDISLSRACEVRRQIKRERGQ